MADLGKSLKCRSTSNRSPLSQSISVLPVTKFNHIWTIKNFSVIPSEVEFICCPNFSPPHFKDKWFMKLRPKTLDDTSGLEYIGIHLFLRSCEERNRQSVRAKYIISVLDYEGDPRYTGECSRHEGRIFKAGTEGHGYKLLAPREQLLNSINNILGPEDTLKILCEITMFSDLVSDLLPNSSDKDLHSEAALCEGSLASDVKNLLNFPHSTDVLIEGNDGVQIKAHRLILSIRSKVFRAMFEHDTKEKAENKIQVKDIEGSVLKEMINFIYSDKVENIEEYAFDLLIAADKYDLIRLKRLCEMYLAKNINLENSCNILIIADMCNCNELKEKVLEFIVANPQKIITSDSWEKQIGKRPLLYKEAFDLLVKKPKLF